MIDENIEETEPKQAWARVNKSFFFTEGNRRPILQLSERVRIKFKLMIGAMW